MADIHDRTGIDLSGKLALVTGGSRGLGRAVARKLCAGGADVLLNYSRDEIAAHEAVKSLAELRGTARAVRADVADPEVFAALLTEIQRDHRCLDILVHNAATFRPMTVDEPDPDQIARDQALTVGPLLYGAPAVAKLMTSGSGRVVAVTSSGARSAVPGYLSLGLAKATLESLVRYLAVAWAGLGIAVNAVSTAKLDKGDAADRAGQILGARTPGGRLTRPEDVADVVALLCTAEAGWLQGQVVTVDGGLGLTP